MTPDRDQRARKATGVPAYRKILNTIEEAAELYSLSERTISDMIRTGLIRPVRYGRRVLIPRAELDSAWQRLEDDG